MTPSVAAPGVTYPSDATGYDTIKRDKKPTAKASYSLICKMTSKLKLVDATSSPCALAFSCHLRYGDCSARCPGSDREFVRGMSRVYSRGGGNFPGGICPDGMSLSRGIIRCRECPITGLQFSTWLTRRQTDCDRL